MKKLFVLLMLLGVTSMASAVSVWTGGGGADQNWMTLANWDTGALPSMSLPSTTGGLAKIYKTTGIANALINTAGPQALQVKIGGPNPVTSPKTWSVLTVADGGVLNVGEYVMVGIDSSIDRSGQLDMTGGTINTGLVTAANGHLFLGHSIAGTTGWLNMSGGTINVTGNFLLARVAGTVGIANLSGNATINTAQFQMNPTGLGTASLNISGNAKLIINGDVSGTINNYIGLGWINDDVQVSTTLNPGKTTVFVPEPATMCLLGLGALSLIRRKK